MFDNLEGFVEALAKFIQKQDWGCYEDETDQGTQTSSEGWKYEGKWKDGRKNGQGTETYPSGRKYEGEWKNNKPWEGTLYDKNENIIGKWINGVKQK